MNNGDKKYMSIKWTVFFQNIYFLTSNIVRVIQRI